MDKNTKLTMSADLYSDIDFDEEKKEVSILSSLFIGDSNSPAIEARFSLDKILSDYIEFNSIPSTTGKHYTNDKYRNKLLQEFQTINNLISKKIEEISNLPDISTKESVNKDPTKNKASAKSQPKSSSKKSPSKKLK